jgi:hypothetical protein
MKRFGTGALFIVFAASTAVAAYTIDACDIDWVSGYLSEHIDGDEQDVADKYDIWVSRASFENGYFYFYYRTLAYYPPGNPEDFSEIYIDADIDRQTGGYFGGFSGFDYKLRWDLGKRKKETAIGFAGLYKWDSGEADYLPTGESYPVARGLAVHTGMDRNEMFTEWCLPKAAIGNVGNLRWGAFLDNSDSAPDDVCPNTMDQLVTPEATPLSLLVVSACLVVFARRHRRGRAVVSPQD